MSDLEWLTKAVELAGHCPPSRTAFSVGAIIVVGDENIGEGHSRQTHPNDHAEEVALRQAAARLPGPGELDRSFTVYSSMEPCGRRASRSRTCAELIIRAGIGRVVFAMAEPDTFVLPQGALLLERAGVEVVQLTESAQAAAEVNRHLL